MFEELLEQYLNTYVCDIELSIDDLNNSDTNKTLYSTYRLISSIRDQRKDPFVEGKST